MSYPHESTDYDIHPGEVLADILTSRGIDRHGFARRIEMLDSTLEAITAGKDIIYGAHLNRLATELNTPVEMWQNLYRNYFKTLQLRAETLVTDIEARRTADALLELARLDQEAGLI